MNKKLLISEVVGGPGVGVMSNQSNASSQYFNGEYYDLEKTTTTVSLDMMYVLHAMSQQFMIQAPKVVEEQLQRLIKEKIRFDMVSWINEEGLPEVTCQLFYGDKLMGEKTTHITKDGIEVVTSPVQELKSGSV